MAIESLRPKLQQNLFASIAASFAQARERRRVADERREQKAIVKTQRREDLRLYLSQEAASMMKDSVWLKQESRDNPLQPMFFTLSYKICELRAMFNGTYSRILDGELAVRKELVTEQGKEKTIVKVIEATNETERINVSRFKQWIISTGTQFAEKHATRKLAKTLDRAITYASDEIKTALTEAFTPDQLVEFTLALQQEGEEMQETLTQVHEALSDILTSREMGALNCMLIDMKTKEITSLESDDPVIQHAIASLKEIYEQVSGILMQGSPEASSLIAEQLTKKHLLEVSCEYERAVLDTASAIENEELRQQAITRLVELDDCSLVLEEQSHESSLASIEQLLTEAGIEPQKKRELQETIRVLQLTLEGLVVRINAGLPLGEIPLDGFGAVAAAPARRYRNIQQTIERNLLLAPEYRLGPLTPQRWAERLNAVRVQPTDGLLTRLWKRPIEFVVKMNPELELRLGFVSGGEWIMNVTAGLIEGAALFLIYKALIAGGIELGPLAELDFHIGHFLLGGVITKATFSSNSYLNFGTYLGKIEFLNLGKLLGPLGGYEVDVTTPAKEVETAITLAADKNQADELFISLDVHEYDYLVANGLIPARHQAFSIPNDPDTYGSNWAGKVIVPVAEYTQQMFRPAHYGAPHVFPTSPDSKYAKGVVLSSRYDPTVLKNRIGLDASVKDYLKELYTDDGVIPHQVELNLPVVDERGRTTGIQLKTVPILVFHRRPTQAAVKGTFEFWPDALQQAAGMKERRDSIFKWGPLLSMIPLTAYALGHFAFTKEFPVWSLAGYPILTAMQAAFSKIKAGTYPQTYYALLYGNWNYDFTAIVPPKREVEEKETNAKTSKEAIKYFFGHLSDIIDGNAVVVWLVSTLALTGAEGLPLVEGFLKSLSAFNSLLPMIIFTAAEVAKLHLGIQSGGPDIPPATPVPSGLESTLGGPVRDMTQSTGNWNNIVFNALSNTPGALEALGVRSVEDMEKLKWILPTDNPNDVINVCLDHARNLAEGCVSVPRPEQFQ